MSPRQGRAGGSSSSASGGSSGGITNRCSASRFDSPIVITQLAVNGSFLIVYLAIVCVWNRIKTRKPNIGRTLPWYTFGLASFLNIVCYILGILWLCLYNCYITTYHDTQILGMTSAVAGELSNVIILGIFIHPFTQNLLRIAGQKTKVVRIINLSLFPLVAALYVPAMVLTGMYNVPIEALVPRKPVSSVRAAYFLAYFIASVVGAIFLVFALLKAVGDHALSSSVKLWMLLTMSALVIGSLFTVVDVFGWSITPREVPDSVWTAFMVLTNLFMAATFVGVLQTTSTTEGQVHDPTEDATYEPDLVEYKPFTYAFPNRSIEQQPPRYSRYSIPHPNSSPQLSQDWGRSRARLSTINSVEIASSPTLQDVPSSAQSRSDALQRLAGTDVRKGSE